MLSDRIILNDIQAFAKIGLYDYERVLGQMLKVDLSLELDLSEAGRENNFAKTIDYVAVSILVREFCLSREFHLIENLAETLVELLFERFSLLKGVEIAIHKTIINAEQFSGQVSVRIHRTRN